MTSRRTLISSAFAGLAAVLSVAGCTKPAAEPETSPGAAQGKAPGATATVPNSFTPAGGGTPPAATTRTGTNFSQ